MSTPSTSSEEWIRLPRPKERCPVTGLSRTSLVEILDEKDPATGELCVKQYRKERHGQQRRIRLIHPARQTLYSAAENMEIDKVVTVEASVKTKIGKGGTECEFTPV